MCPRLIPHNIQVSVVLRVHADQMTPSAPFSRALIVEPPPSLLGRQKEPTASSNQPSQVPRPPISLEYQQSCADVLQDCAGRYSSQMRRSGRLGSHIARTCRRTASRSHDLEDYRKTPPQRRSGVWLSVLTDTPDNSESNFSAISSLKS
jgi:hypothetical protein